MQGPRTSGLGPPQRQRPAVGLVVAGALAACSAASPDPALGELLQVEGAQWRPGQFPADEGGPATISLSTQRTHLIIGRLDSQLRAALEPSARAAVIGIDGVDGTWLIPTGVPDVETPELASARAAFGVATGFSAGPFILMMAGSDRLGQFGPPMTITLIAEDELPVTGELVIGLAWDGSADLDLHVVEPGGGEAWSDKPNTMPVPAPGTPVDPLEYERHGILDHDGNAECRRDGRPSENVIWSVPPPPGDYVVRVDARSMCGAPIAAGYVAAYRAGQLIGAARGVATPEDTLQPHGAGAGILALRFSL
jgi:hypothetical protein